MHPVVINMSLGGPVLDAVEKAAIDYAISKGVVIVASAGNEGDEGMGYPGAYAPVVSVAAAGWVREWTTDSTWWRTLDFPNPTQAEDLYITDFSSREKDGQDLDVAAPGSWVVGPYQLNSGKTSYFFLGGTSMAAPHVAGIAALMLQKNASLQQADVESILESTAIPLPAGSRSITLIDGSTDEVSWGDDASGSRVRDGQRGAERHAVALSRKRNIRCMQGPPSPREGGFFWRVASALCHVRKKSAAVPLLSTGRTVSFGPTASVKGTPAARRGRKATALDPTRTRGLGCRKGDTPQTSQCPRVRWIFFPVESVRSRVCPTNQKRLNPRQEGIDPCRRNHC